MVKFLNTETWGFESKILNLGPLENSWGAELADADLDATTFGFSDTV